MFSVQCSVILIKDYIESDWQPVAWQADRVSFLECDVRQEEGWSVAAAGLITPHQETIQEETSQVPPATAKTGIIMINWNRNRF